MSRRRRPVLALGLLAAYTTSIKRALDSNRRTVSHAHPVRHGPASSGHSDIHRDIHTGAVTEAFAGSLQHVKPIARPN
jgi:hypothetical protein